MSAYDHWKLDNGVDEAAEARAERLDEMVDALLDERMADPARVASELDELAGTSDHNSDGNTMFSADIAAVLLASADAFDGEAIRYMHKLRDQVRESMRRDAETDAWAEIARQDEGPDYGPDYGEAA